MDLNSENRFQSVIHEIDDTLSNESKLGEYALRSGESMDQAKKQLQMMRLFFSSRKDWIDESRKGSPNWFAHATQGRSQAFWVALGISLVAAPEDGKYALSGWTEGDIGAMLELLEDWVIQGLSIDVSDFPEMAGSSVSNAAPILVETINVSDDCCEWIESALFWHRWWFWKIAGLKLPIKESALVDFGFNVHKDALDDFISEHVACWLSWKSLSPSEVIFAKSKKQLDTLRNALKSFKERYGDQVIELDAQQPLFNDLDLPVILAYLHERGEIEIMWDRYWSTFLHYGGTRFPVRVQEINPPRTITLSEDHKVMHIDWMPIRLGGEKGSLLMEMLLGRDPWESVGYDELHEEVWWVVYRDENRDYEFEASKSQLRKYYFAARHLNQKVLEKCWIKDFLKIDSKSVSIGVDWISE